MIGLRMYFLGKAEEAIDFYSNVFDTKADVVMKYGESTIEGMEIEEESKNLIMHAEMKIYGSKLLLCDMMYSMEELFNQGNNNQIYVEYKDEERASKEFEKLASNDGMVIVPFGSKDFQNFRGHVVDKFGNFWIFISA